MITEDTANFSNKDTSFNEFNNSKVSNEFFTLFYGLTPLNTLDIKSNFEKIKPGLSKILSGEIANPTENQSVSHHQCRSLSTPENIDLIDFIEKVDSAEIVVNQNQITHVCQIGVGGSSSGPKAIYQTIKSWGYHHKITGTFISSHDEQHIKNVLVNIPISSTLFIIASKSGTTVEVVKAIESIIQFINIPKDVFLKNQCVTITTKDSPLDTNNYLKRFIFSQSIGGRYSTTSQIGTLILGLCFGKKVIEEFLTGAYKTDQYELIDSNLNSNIAFQTALLNVSYRTELNLTQLGIIPYGEAFKELAFFFVQLISESLGKSTSISGEESLTNNCPQIIYGIGPDAQHSFFQQLHQSKTITPCEFVYSKPKTPNQHHILQQICGQMVALAQGSSNENLHHNFSGNRPSILIYLKAQTASALGSLIASYENRVMFESLLLNINAFDQPGVELGKKLTKAISKEGTDLASQIYQSII